MPTVAELFSEAWKHHQAGSFPQAEQLYRQILKDDPSHADSWCFLGAACQSQGKVRDAELNFRRAIQLLPNHPSARNCLGVVLAQQGKLDEAANAFQDLIIRQPGDAGAHNNLGLVRAQQGRWQEAIGHYRKALAVQPDYAMARQNLDHALKSAGQPAPPPAAPPPPAASNEAAAEGARHNDRGIELANHGKFDEAALEFQRAIALWPGDASAHSNLGNIHYYQGNYDEAIAKYQDAVRIKPHYPEAHSNLGNLLLLKGRADEAMASCREALRLKPDFAGAFLNLGNAHREKQQVEESIAAYKQVLRLNPDSPDGHSNLAGLYKDQGNVEDATTHYQHAVRLRPSSTLRILVDTLLPPVYKSTADVQAWRDKLAGNVRRLREKGVKQDLTTESAQPPFFLAYQGFNDRDLQRELAQLYTAPPNPPRRARGPNVGGKIKVGLASKYFRVHTMGRWMRGLVAQLSRREFDVTVFSVGHYEDEIATIFKQQADRYIELPAHLPTARRLIAEQNLDVLIYTDIGMDQVTYSLAFSRLAPVQCVTVGHPDTTGISTLDYYLSSDELESDESDQHYTENLVRFKKLPIFFYKPPIRTPLKDRQYFGLSNTEHIYSCLQTAFKFHPDFDEILGGILRGDPRGTVVLSCWKVPRWEVLLRERFAVTLPDVLPRIRFLPMMGYEDYLNMLTLADVLLDTLHFGGGSTSYEGLAVGTPIVTCPTKFLRGRITLSLYKQMGVLDCVAKDRRQYVEMALRLGTDPDYQKSIRKKILDSNGALFENAAGVRELEQWLPQAVASADRERA